MNFRYTIFILFLLSTPVLQAQTWNSVRAEKLYQQALNRRDSSNRASAETK